MFTLIHDGEGVGTTQLERGDPSIQSVSGLFNNIGGSKALSGWIRSIDGKEDDGVVYIELNKDFSLVDEAGKAITFEGGTLIAVPADDEVYLDISGVSEEDYKAHFEKHLSAMESGAGDDV